MNERVEPHKIYVYNNERLVIFVDDSFEHSFSTEFDSDENLWAVHPFHCWTLGNYTYELLNNDKLLESYSEQLKLLLEGINFNGYIIGENYDMVNTESFYE